MRNSIKKRLNELSTVSARIIKHGMQLSCLLILIALAISTHGDLSTLPKYITEASVSIFAIVIIGGLMFDYCVKRNSDS